MPSKILMQWHKIIYTAVNSMMSQQKPPLIIKISISLSTEFLTA